jgi:hypothetical protein
MRSKAGAAFMRKAVVGFALFVVAGSGGPDVFSSSRRPVAMDAGHSVRLPGTPA